jgi:hypothetical protein
MSLEDHPMNKNKKQTMKIGLFRNGYKSYKGTFIAIIPRNYWLFVVHRNCTLPSNSRLCDIK